MDKEKKVFFRAKSEWQKDNCLFCTNPATLEAVYKHDALRGSYVRCCERPECKKMAEKLAIAPWKN